MIIGIDIDGCMTDDNAFRLEQWGKYLYEHNLPVMDLPHGYENKVTWMERDEYRKVFRSFLFEYIENVEPRRYAAEVTKKLHEDGHKLIVCTGRNGSIEQSERGEKIRSITRNWLDRHGIYYDELVFTGFPKIDYVRHCNCDLFIEDFITTIDIISQEMPVLVFDNPYNYDYQNPNTTRVYSWYDIYRYIRERS